MDKNIEYENIGCTNSMSTLDKNREIDVLKLIKHMGLNLENLSNDIKFSSNSENGEELINKIIKHTSDIIYTTYCVTKNHKK